MAEFMYNNDCNGWEIDLTNGSFIFMLHFDGSPGSLCSGSTSTFKLDISSFAGIDDSSYNRPSLAIVCKPIFVCMQFKCSRWSGIIALDVIKKTVAHQMYEHILVPLAVIPFCLAQFFTCIGSTRSIKNDRRTRFVGYRNGSHVC